MTLQLILGVDPGQGGAIALLADDRPAGFLDMPTVERNKGGGNMVDGRRLGGLVRGALVQHRGAYVIAVIERVQAIGGKGEGEKAQKARSNPTSAFRFGQADGVVRGVLGALSIPLIEVEPQEWKRKYGFIGREKDYARECALGLYPGLSLDLSRKKDNGRADALWIAKWARETDQVGRAA